MSDVELAVAAVYERSLPVSEERVWENVLDWEHLPYLHDSSFGGITCHEAGDWGWRARVVGRGADDDGFEIELLLAETRDRYVTRTLTGAAAGSEIWTTVMPRAAHRTDVRVEFHLPAVLGDALEAIGQGYVGVYTQLWDEDEHMMCERQRQLDARANAGAPGRETIDLGPVSELSATRVDTKTAGPIRVEAHGDTWFAYSVVCPHLLGPVSLESDGRTLYCPWHGYRFDPVSGRSCDGRRLRLRAGRVDTSGERALLVLD